MKNRQKLKGSVLFTVVAVMMVVLVFVMSALTIAGATNRRAYSDYAKAQTEYSARSALEATLKYLRTPVDSKNNQLAQQIVNMSPATAPISLDVKFDGGTEASMGKDGTAKVTIKCLDDQYEYLDGEKHAIVAITASVTLAGETSEETMIVLKDPPSSSGKGGSNAVTSLAGFNSGTTPRILGGSSTNLLEDNNNTQITWQNSNGIMSGNMVINSSLHIENKIRPELNKNEGIAVYGDVTTGNDFIVSSLLDKSKISNYKDIPYFFVDGTLNLTANQIEVGEEDKGLNFYCRQLYYGVQNNANMYADVYIFGTDTSYSADKNQTDENINNYYNNYELENYGNKMKSPGHEYLSVIGHGSNSSTKLLSWANDIINNTTGKTYGGNIFSNGSICFKDTFKFEKDVTIRQGAYFGFSNNNDQATIEGKLSVGGLLIINKGSVSCSELCLSSLDNIIIRKEGNLIINGTKYDGADTKGHVYVNGKEYNSFSEAYNSVKDGSVTTGEVKYPNEMTRDELVGIVKDDKSNDANNDGVGDNKVVDLPVESYGKFLDKSEDGSTIYYEPDYFKTWEDTKDKNGNIIEGMWHKFYDAATDGNPIVPEYKIDDVKKDEIKIDKSCILSGGSSNSIKKDIIFDVPKGTEIWVYLKDGFVSASESGNVIVKSGGTVNFYTDKEIEMNGQSCIATEYYYNKKGDSNITLNQNPTDKSEIPNIYIYCDYKNNDSTTNHIKLQNDNFITGYIFAPTYTVNSGAGGISKDITYNINDSSIVHNGGRLAVIGSIFAGNFENGNMEVFVYVSDAGMGSNSSGELSSWATLAYTAGDGLGVE